MARRRSTDQSKLGVAILGRITEVGAPKPLKPFVTAFAREQKELEAAAQICDDARALRDAALHDVGAADAALDATIDALANRMIGADMGTRKNAFSGFSPHSPGALKELPYATEVREVGKLLAAVRRAKPVAVVAKAAADCASAATNAEKAIRGLTKPQAAFAKQLTVRDALLPGWTRAFERLRANAKAAWIDALDTYRSVFAPPDVVVGTKRPRKAKPSAPEPIAASATNGAS